MIDTDIAYAANGTLIAISRKRTGRKAIPRIPANLVDQLVTLKGIGKRFISAPQFIAATHTIYERVRALNKLGINGTCVNDRTGCHQQH